MPTREEMRSLAENIVHSYDSRAEGITSLNKEVTRQQQATRVQLQEWDKAHQAMAQQQRADLAKGRADLAGEVGSMLKGFDAELKEMDAAHAAMSHELKATLAKGRADLVTAERQRSSEVNAWMNEIATAHQAMAQQQRADLAKGRAELAGEVGSMLKGFDAELKEMRNVQAGGRHEWQKLVATMQAKRGMPLAKTKKETAEVTPEPTDLPGRLFEYLANHPDGTRLVEMEHEFGMARIQIAKALRSLMDENKVEKRELLYFAI